MIDAALSLYPASHRMLFINESSLFGCPISCVQCNIARNDARAIPRGKSILLASRDAALSSSSSSCCFLLSAAAVGVNTLTSDDREVRDRGARPDARPSHTELLLRGLVLYVMSARPSSHVIVINLLILCPLVGGPLTSKCGHPIYVPPSFLGC